MVDNKVEQDEFPDWFTIVSTSRTIDFSSIDVLDLSERQVTPECDPPTYANVVSARSPQSVNNVSFHSNCSEDSIVRPKDGSYNTESNVPLQTNPVNTQSNPQNAQVNPNSDSAQHSTTQPSGAQSSLFSACAPVNVSTARVNTFD